MGKPTLDILDAILPEYEKYQTIEPLLVRDNEYTSNFYLNNQKWEKHYKEVSKVHFDWKEIKYSDVVNKKVEINKEIPDKQGIYLFIVKPQQTIFDVPKYVFYVGIAGANTSSRTLQKRLRDYFAESHLKKRDAVRILIYKYFNNVYIAYSPILTRRPLKLEQIETSLIGFFGTHILANRDDIPVELKPQAKAFNI